MKSSKDLVSICIGWFRLRSRYYVDLGGSVCGFTPPVVEDSMSGFMLRYSDGNVV